LYTFYLRGTLLKLIIGAIVMLGWKSSKSKQSTVFKGKVYFMIKMLPIIINSETTLWL